MKILLIEDHQDIAGVIFDYFELKGHQLDHAANGKHGLALSLAQHYDVIILDIMLPMMDGLSICRTLREKGIETPVLMLTARDQQSDQLDGFEHGADDYLVKPFDLKILEARLLALHRRNAGNVATRQLTFGELTLDMASCTLERDGRQFALNKTQFTLLKLLMTRAPGIATREELIHTLWQDEAPDGDILRSHIYQLRNRIDKPFDHHYLRTIPKQGYQLVAKANS